MLDAVAAVLRLDRDAVEHLRALAHAPHPRAEASPERVLPDLVRLLDNQVDAPAFVTGARMDVLAANALARVLHPTFTPGRNVVRDAFLDDGAQAGYVDLEQVQRACVSALRAAVAQLARDAALTALVGELTLNSRSFAHLWARHEVHPKGVGSKRFRHPALGTVELDQMVFDVGGTDGQRLIVYHAEPASPDGRALALLGPLAGEHEAALAPHGSA